MIYDLVNMSDAVTFVGDDDTLAGAAVLVLGRGRYGLNNENGDSVLPLMLFGGLDEWLKERSIADFDGYLAANRIGIAGFLDTARYCDVSERKRYGDAVKMDDDRRSSLNNIGAACKQIAEHLREREKEAVA